MTRDTTKNDSTATKACLYIAFDLGRNSWRMATSDGIQKVRERTVERKTLAGLQGDVLAEVSAARLTFRLPEDAPVHAVIEAGRDGFWIVRWLALHGIQCIVVDSTSILVDQRAKRVKTDAIDARALLSQLIRHVHGEGTLRVVNVPDPEIEDARELGRTLQRMTSTRTSLTNTVTSLLFKHGVATDWSPSLPHWLDDLKTGDGKPLGRWLSTEVRMLCAQVELLESQIAELEQERAKRIVQPTSPLEQKARMMEEYCGIGALSAWELAHELFWRKFKNDKAVGAFLGLTPTPYFTGESRREQGISKAGPGRLRALLIQLAWAWLRYQPDSRLAIWYRERYGATASRSRRGGIVAVARKLAILLWKLTEFGVIPEGAKSKPLNKRTRPAQRRPKRSTRPVPAELLADSAAAA